MSELTLEPFASFDAVRDDWTRLALESGNVFATWDLASLWWSHFGLRGEPILTLCRSSSGRAVGLLPLYRVRAGPLRLVRFIGHGPADQLGPICRPEDRSQVAAALERMLARLEPDVFIGEQVPGDYPLEQAIGAKVLSTEGNPVLRFEVDSWEALLSSWSSNRRGQVRRLERRLTRDHETGYRLVGDPTEEDLDTLFALHDARWSEGGSAFARHAAFQREFALMAGRQGWLRLWFLEADGRPVAAWYGLRFGQAESYYQAGRDPDWDDRSVGLVLLTHTIRAALEDGMREYRFLRGGESFKYRFANADPGLKTITATRGRLGAMALATALIARRGARRVRGRLARR